jgi:FkbM family methyltransferase
LKQVQGLWLPDGDEHFESQFKVGPSFWGKPTYQFNKFAAIFPHVKDFRHAVDIGAHCGLWSRVLERLFPAVTAFEPVPGHIDCLRQNTRHVRIEPVALGKDAGKARMHCPASNSGNAALSVDGEIEVDVMTLDSYEFANVDFIKMDCEGSEYNVVLGGLETIKRNRPAIIIEQHKGWANIQGVHQFGALKLLEGLGMKVITKFNSDYLLTF